MRLIRIKVKDKKGFRGLPYNFEYKFRDDLKNEAFTPFICTGLNGSGKSNLLELLANIFFHLENKIATYRPDLFEYHYLLSPRGYQDKYAIPNAFELEFLGVFFTQFKKSDDSQTDNPHVQVIKQPEKSTQFFIKNSADIDPEEPLSTEMIRMIFPDHIVGYSSGENEILSLPFLKRRFIDFDEYWDSIHKELPFLGQLSGRMAFLDQEYNQAILLCNYIFNDGEALDIIKEEIGITHIESFRIIIQDINYPIISVDDNLESALERKEKVKFQKSLLNNISDIQDKLASCATAFYSEESHFYYDFYLDDTVKKCFKQYFGSALELFRVFQLLFTLNLYSVTNKQKLALYQSKSLYANETIPALPSDQRVFRFKNFWIRKKNLPHKILSKSLSDGENQLLHVLGMCLLYKDTDTLFLLDEPETHFNPHWKSKLISLINRVINLPPKKEEGQTESSQLKEQIKQCEMLLTTHSPFPISDSLRKKVLIVEKDEKGEIVIDNPKYNTFGASIDKITAETFDQAEDIGDQAQKRFDEYYQKIRDPNCDKRELLNLIHEEFGDSLERFLLLKTVRDRKKKD